MTATPVDDVERFDTAVASADTDGAIDVVEDLLGLGVDPVTIMVDVIAPVQERVGRRWQDGTWSVAQEHAATTVTVSALEAVSRATRPDGGAHGRVVIACAEREWHAVPAMIVAGALRAEGWQITLLGASTPTARLSRYLQDLGPDVTAVSCSVAAGLPNARGFIEASTTAGIPVLAGGAAFGPDDRRSRALGATAWARDARGATEAIAQLPAVVEAAPALPAEVTREVAALRSAHRDLVQDAATHAAGAGAEDPERSLRDALDQAVHAVTGAVLTSDERLLTETAGWASDVLRARGHRDAGAIVHDALAHALRDYPLAFGLVQRHWPGATS